MTWQTFDKIMVSLSLLGVLILAALCVYAARI